MRVTPVFVGFKRFSDPEDDSDVDRLSLPQAEDKPKEKDKCTIF